MELQRWLTPRADEKIGGAEQTPHQEQVTEKEREGRGGEGEEERDVRGTGKEGGREAGAGERANMRGMS